MPVEAVMNSSQINKMPAQLAGSSLYDDIGLSSPLFGDESGYGLFPDVIGMDEAYLFSDTLGVGAYNPRVLKSFKQDMAQEGASYEHGVSIPNEEKALLTPLASRLHEYRDPFFNVRLREHEVVTNTLQSTNKKEKGVATYLTYCAKFGGLKDPNQDISFDNLKNPLKLIKDLQSVDWKTPNANENINLLSEAAIKERSPELAACLLKGTSEGGLTSIGVDSKTAEKLLIESRKDFNNDAEYYNFITNIDKAYQKLNDGKGLDQYLKENYKPAAQKAVSVAGILAGMAAGAAKGAKYGSGLWGKLGSVAGGAVLGGLAASVVSAPIYKTSFFGKNEEGHKLLETIDKARSEDNDCDLNRYRQSGGLTAASALSPF